MLSVEQKWDVMLTAKVEATATRIKTCLVWLKGLCERWPFSVDLSRDLSSEEVPFSTGALVAALPTLAADRVLTIVDERPSHVNWNSRVQKWTNYHQLTVQNWDIWKISSMLWMKWQHADSLFLLRNRLETDRERGNYYWTSAIE